MGNCRNVSDRWCSRLCRVWIPFWAIQSESFPRDNSSFFTLLMLDLTFTSSSPLLLSLEGKCAFLAGLFLTYLENFSSLFPTKQYLQGIAYHNLEDPKSTGEFLWLLNKFHHRALWNGKKALKYNMECAPYNTNTRLNNISIFIIVFILFTS